MSSALSADPEPASTAIMSGENEGGILVAPRAPRAPPHIARSGKRAEDTAMGCRAKAAADLDRAGAPGGDFMRLRLEHSAAVWSERADLLDRLDRKFLRRTGTAA